MVNDLRFLGSALSHFELSTSRFAGNTLWFRISPCESHVQFLGIHRAMQDDLKPPPATRLSLSLFVLGTTNTISQTSRR